jgi:hypothetical protein
LFLLLSDCFFCLSVCCQADRLMVCRAEEEGASFDFELVVIQGLCWSAALKMDRSIRLLLFVFLFG